MFFLISDKIFEYENALRSLKMSRFRVIRLDQWRYDEKDFPLFFDLRSQCRVTSWIISFEMKKVK